MFHHSKWIIFGQFQLSISFTWYCNVKTICACFLWLMDIQRCHNCITWWNVLHSYMKCIKISTCVTNIFFILGVLDSKCTNLYVMNNWHTVLSTLYINFLMEINWKIPCKTFILICLCVLTACLLPCHTFWKHTEIHKVMYYLEPLMSFYPLSTEEQKRTKAKKFNIIHLYVFISTSIWCRVQW